MNEESIEAFLTGAREPEASEVVGIIEALAEAVSRDDRSRVSVFIDLARIYGARAGDWIEIATTIAQLVALSVVPRSALDPDASRRVSQSEWLSELISLLPSVPADEALQDNLLELSAELLPLEEQADGGAEQLFLHVLRLPEERQQPRLSALAHRGLSELYTFQDRTQEAGVHFAEFSALLDAIRGETRLLLSYIQGAEWFAESGELAAARARLLSVESAVRRQRDPHILADFALRIGSAEMLLDNRPTSRLWFNRALRTARRTHARDLEYIALHGVAVLDQRAGRTKAALDKLKRALALASDEGDLWRAQALAREQASVYLDQKRFESAAELFGLARTMNVELGDLMEAARCAADLGAAQLSRAIQVIDAHPPDAREIASSERLGALEVAATTLAEGLDTLITHSDDEWAMRAGNNLRVVWQMQDSALEGSAYFDRRGKSRKRMSPVLRAFLLRNAAFLGLWGARSSRWALSRLVAASELNDQGPASRAWDLADDAHTLNTIYSDYAGARRLYDLALPLMREADDRLAHAYLLNDSALVLRLSGSLEEADERLSRVVAYAATEENRVLGAMATINRGEVLLEIGRGDEGRTDLEAGVELALAVGDRALAARALTTIAESVIAGRDDLELARTAANRARSLAEAAGSGDEKARATSTLADLAGIGGDPALAHDLLVEASAVASKGDRDHYRALALVVRVRMDDWPRFSRDLDRYFRDAQRSRTQLQLAGQLWLSAAEWLRKGSPRRAAKPLAYAILLAFDHYSAWERHPPEEDDEFQSNRALLLAVGEIVVAVRTMLNLDVVDPGLRMQLRAGILRTLERVIGPADAELAMGAIDTLFV